MLHLLTNWPQVQRKIAAAKHILFLSDFDGTLSPIVKHPARAELANNIRQSLLRLSRDNRFTIGIISGRKLSDLQEKVGIRGLIYVGNHGLEIAGPEESWIHPQAAAMKQALNHVYDALKVALDKTTGVLIENKGLSLSVHYRQVPPSEICKVMDLLAKVVNERQMQDKLSSTSGKMVCEIRPLVGWDKGNVVQLLHNKFADSQGRLLTFYLGDDLNDEGAFKALNNDNAVTIYVGSEKQSQSSSARYFLRSVIEVNELLRLVSDSRTL